MSPGIRKDETSQRSEQESTFVRIPHNNHTVGHRPLCTNHLIMKLLKRISIHKTSGPVSSNPKLLLLDLDDPTVLSEASERGFLLGGSTKKHNVHFCEAKNQYYDYEPVEGVIDAHNIWYHKDELQQFRADAEDEGRRASTRERSSHDPSWSASLLKTYQSFCRVSSAHDMDLIFSAMANPEPVDPNLVGLEAHGIPQLKSARNQRRNQLLNQIGRIQACTDMSRSERTKRIRKLSHEASRPSRLFALHLAQLVHA